MKITAQVLKQRASHPLEEAKYLNLSSLGIGAIEELHYCPNLQVLDLSSNSIEEVEGISCCTHLWNINLGNNQISCLNELTNFYAIGTLDLSNNNLSWKGLTKLRNVIILDLRLHGNPMLEKDIYYRIHAIDCLPNIWMLDGRIVSSAERVQVQQFFWDSALSSHPVRRKTSGRSRVAENGLKLYCVHGLRTSSLVKQFPVNEVQSAETDLRRLLYLTRNMETDINIMVDSKSGEPAQNARLPQSYLQDIIIRRHDDWERFNMLLLILVASLEFRIPQALVTETLEVAQLNPYACVDTTLLFTLKRDLQIQLVSLLMSASKLDREVQIPGSGGLYDGLYLCLHYAASCLEKERWKTRKKSWTCVRQLKYQHRRFVPDHSRKLPITLNAYLRPRTAPLAKTKRVRLGQRLPSSHEHKKLVQFQKDHRMLLAAEVVLLMNVMPSFYILIETEPCMRTLLLTAVGSVSITEWILNMAKEAREHRGSLIGLQDEISSHVIRQIERVAIGTKNKALQNASFPLNFQTTTEPELEWKIILSTKNAYPKRPKSAVLTSGEHLYSGRRRAACVKRNVLSTKEQKNFTSSQHGHENSFSSKVTLGSNILLGPQNMARVIAMPESNVALVQMDKVPAANGSVIIQSRNIEDHYCYVDVAMLEADRQLGCLKPRGTVGDRITLQAAVQDRRQTSMSSYPEFLLYRVFMNSVELKDFVIFPAVLSRTPDALLIDKEYTKQAPITESKSKKSFNRMPSRNPTNKLYSQVPCKSSGPRCTFMITKDDGEWEGENLEEPRSNMVTTSKTLPPRPLSAVWRERLDLQLPPRLHDVWLESGSLKKKSHLFSTAPTELSTQNVIEVPGFQPGSPELTPLDAAPTTNHETQFDENQHYIMADLTSHPQNESLTNSSSARICLVSDSKAEDWAVDSVEVELNKEKSRESTAKDAFDISKDEEGFLDGGPKVSTSAPRITDKTLSHKRVVSARHPKQLQAFASRNRPMSAVVRRQDICGKSRQYRDDVGFERPDSATSFQFQQTEAWRSSASSFTHITFDPKKKDGETKHQTQGHHPRTSVWSTPPQRPTSPNPSTTAMNEKSVQRKKEKVMSSEKGMRLTSNWLAHGKDLHEAYKQSRVYMSPRLPGYLDGSPGLHQKKGVPSSIPLTTSRVLYMNNIPIQHGCKKSKPSMNTHEYLPPGIGIPARAVYTKLPSTSQVKKTVGW